jgi:hypothetical protein
MTIKQFGYLAGGAILAYISYKLPVPFFFSWPLAFMFAIGGVGFAFVPVEDRPMDIWVLSFIKNIYNPTQFVWSHEAPKPISTPPPPPARPVSQIIAGPSSPVVPAPAAGKPVSDVLQRIFAPTHTSVTHAPPPPAVPQVTPVHTTVTTTHHAPGPFDWLSQLLSSHPKPHTGVTLPASPVPTPSVTGRHLDISSPPQVTSASSPMPEAVPTPPPKESLEAKVKEISHALEEKTQSHARILELQKQLTDVLSERDHMRNEMAQLKSKPTPPPASPMAPPPPMTPPATTQDASHVSSVATPQTPREPTVKIITPESALKAGLPRLTTFPNVVTGITRDSDNNLLPGVLVTVRDKDGMPIRALKTNRLGQFAASTPIANGTYLVEIEDPRNRYTFDRVQVTLNGSIVPALEIIAKSQKEVAREKLAKEIFGT